MPVSQYDYRAKVTFGNTPVAIIYAPSLFALSRYLHLSYDSMRTIVKNPEKSNHKNVEIEQLEKNKNLTPKHPNVFPPHVLMASKTHDNIKKNTKTK